MIFYPRLVECVGEITARLIVDNKVEATVNVSNELRETTYDDPQNLPLARSYALSGRHTMHVEVGSYKWDSEWFGVD